MKHLGDITKISGYEVEPVDIICGGSPCQDLSVAGKRAGLAGERSGLFMEQIRIIKEMRERGKADDVIRPRYMVWENVPGAFSSNNGEDFRAVLEETAKIADENATIPRPENGKWAPAGCIVGDGWSIAWRVHDAQFWGAAQRRKRICLLADFDGQTAGRILFELRRKTDDFGREQVIMDTGAESRSEVQSVGKGVSRDIAESGKEGQKTAGDAGTCIEETGGAIGFHLTQDPVSSNELSYACSCGNSKSGQCVNGVVYGIGSYDSNAMKSNNPSSGIYKADTSRTLDLNGGNPGCNQGGMAVVQGFDAYNQASTGDVAMPLRNKAADSDHIPVVCIEGNGSRDSHKGDGYRESETMYTLNTVEQHAVCIENHPADSRVKIAKDGKVQTLSSRMGTGGGNVPMVMSIGHDERSAKFTDNEIVDPLTSSDYKDPIKITYQQVTGTLNPGAHPGSYNGQDAYNDMFVANTVVRRLTPLECTRLQGFPDGWVDIGEWVDSKGKLRKDSDANKYKALGNSIALPFWQWLAQRIVAEEHPRQTTMASLFSGIGGFELVFSMCGCKPVWASEIEDFPIAVTKKRFKEEQDVH